MTKLFQQVNEVILGMRCDGIGPGRCPDDVVFSPRVCVPDVSNTLYPLKMMTTLHYCERHCAQFDLAKFIEPSVKRAFERLARDRHGTGFKCDFDNAYTDLVRVRTPEYRHFLGRMLREAV